MDAAREKALKSCFSIICDELDPLEVIPRLIGVHVLSKREADDIGAEKTPYEKNQKLVRLLLGKTSRAFDAFSLALEETGQQNLKFKICSAIAQPLCPELTAEMLEHGQLLKKYYIEQFGQFFLSGNISFTFDMESTFVPLSLSTDRVVTDNHCELIEQLFAGGNRRLIVLEGDAGYGKTCLMRRIAYDWSQGKLEQFGLVLYTEFHRLSQSRQFSSIIAMALEGVSMYIVDANDMGKIRNTVEHMLNGLAGQRILVLLDGYDGNQVGHCNQLELFLRQTNSCSSHLLFNVILSSRPEYINECRFEQKEIAIIKINGIASFEQKENYICAHFTGNPRAAEDSKIVVDLLKSSETFMELARTPLFLFFICLLNKECQMGNITEILQKICTCLADRCHINKSDEEIHSSDLSEEGSPHYLSETSFYCKLGRLAFENLCHRNNAKLIFSQKDLDECGISKSASNMGFLLVVDDYSSDQKLLQHTFKFPHKSFQAFFGSLYFWKSTDTINCIEVKMKIGRNESELTQFISKIAQSNVRVLEKISSNFKEKITLCIDIYNQIVDFKYSDRNPALKANLYEVCDNYCAIFRCQLPKAISTAPFSDVSYYGQPLAMQAHEISAAMLDIERSPLLQQFPAMLDIDRGPLLQQFLQLQLGVGEHLARSPNLFSYEREATLLRNEVIGLQSMFNSIGIVPNNAPDSAVIHAQQQADGAASGSNVNTMATAAPQAQQQFQFFGPLGLPHFQKQFF